MLHGFEPALELGVRLLQGTLGIQPQLAREAGGCKQQIADLLLEGVGTGVGGQRRDDFAELFFELGQDARDVRPVEADACGLLGDPVGTEEGGQGRGNSRKDRSDALVCLALFPRAMDRGAVFDGFAAEHMRVTIDHLLVEVLDHAGQGLTLQPPVEEPRDEDDVKQEIPHFFLNRGGIFLVDRSGQFVRFFEQVAAQVSERLLSIPRAAVGAAQRVDESFELRQSVVHSSSLCRGQEPALEFECSGFFSGMVRIAASLVDQNERLLRLSRKGAGFVDEKIKVTDKRMFTAEGELRSVEPDAGERAETEGRAGASPENASRAASGSGGGQGSTSAAGSTSAGGSGGAGAREVRSPRSETPPEQAGKGLGERQAGAFPEPTFIDLIGLLAQPIAMFLGDAKLPGGETEENLPLARYHIDLLELVEAKTKGNISSKEAKLLEDLLYQLRMRYLQKAG